MGVKDLLNGLDELLPSKSEWMGFYTKNGKTNILLPKSLQSGNSNDLAKVVNALFFIHQLDLKRDGNNNVRFLSGEVDLENNLSKVIFYYLYEVLKATHDDVLKNNFFNYKRVSENTLKIKGKINFGKSASKNLGLMHKKFCEYNVINFEHPVLHFTRFIFKYFSQVLSEVGDIRDETVDSLLSMTGTVEHVLSDCDSNLDVTRIAMDLMSGRYDNERHLQEIIPNCKILASTYLDNTVFFSEQKSSQKLPHGIVLNLNRAFEIILRKSVEAFLKEAYIKEQYKIHHDNNGNFTKYLKDGQKYFQMKPDCWFEVNGKTVIVDAKHKVSSRGTSDSDIDFEKIDRNDLYQITTYAFTHPNSEKGVYGILALHEESRFTVFDDYILGTNKIDIQDKSIHLISMKLVKFLYDVGDSISNSLLVKEFGAGQDHEAFVKLGADIFRELDL